MNMARVWIIGDKRWGKRSERRYVVEWQTEHPKFASLTPDEQSDFGPDRHPFHHKVFPGTPEGRDDAIRFAKKQVAASFWGVVDVDKQSLEHINDNAWDWNTDSSEQIACDWTPPKPPESLAALDTARTIAAALGQPEGHPGTARLAGDLAGGGK